MGLSVCFLLCQISDFTDFQKQQIVEAYLVKAPVTATANAVGVSRVLVSKVMTTYRIQGKTIPAYAQLWMKTG